MPPVPGAGEESGEKGLRNHEIHEDRKHGSVL